MPSFKKYLSNIEQHISDLSDTAKWAVIRRLIPRAQSEGFSQNQTRQIFREFGFSFTDAIFNQSFRQARESQSVANRIKYVGRDKTISESVLDVADFPFTERYFIAATFILRDALTGQAVPMYQAIETNTLGTRIEIEQDILESILQNSPELADRIEDVSIRYGFINFKAI